MRPEQYLCAKDVKERLRVSLRKAYKIIRDAEHTRFGRNIRITESALERYISHENKPKDLHVRAYHKKVV